MRNNDYVLSVDETKVIVEANAVTGSPKTSELVLKFSVKSLGEGEINTDRKSVTWVEDDQKVSSTFNPSLGVGGDNVKYDINNLFGNASTAFGKAVNNNIGANYKYTLDTDIAAIVEIMENKVSYLNLSSPLIKPHDMPGTSSCVLINRSDLVLSDEAVNDALESFALETGIQIAVVVDTAEGVFGKTMPWSSIIFIIAILALVGFCIYYIVKKISEKKKMDSDFDTSGSSSHIL